MTNLKQQLIRLGEECPDLRDHLRPVLDHIKQASMSLEEAAAIAVVNAEMIPDPTNRGVTDAWLVPLHDMVALKDALNQETDRNVRLSSKKASNVPREFEKLTANQREHLRQTYIKIKDKADREKFQDGPFSADMTEFHEALPEAYEGYPDKVRIAYDGNFPTRWENANQKAGGLGLLGYSDTRNHEDGAYTNGWYVPERVEDFALRLIDNKILTYDTIEGVPYRWHRDRDGKTPIFYLNGQWVSSQEPDHGQGWTKDMLRQTLEWTRDRD